MEKPFELAKGVDLKDFTMLNPLILNIFASYMQYAAVHGLPVKINSLINGREKVKHEKAQTHITGRAIDVSTFGWSDYHIKRVVKYLNKKHYGQAALSASDLVPRAAVYGDVYHRHHIHLQSRYLTKEEKKKFREELKLLIE